MCKESQLCHCRTRCHSQKNCPCKATGQSCLPGCHPGHTCTNTGNKPMSPPIDLSEQTVTSNTNPDLENWKNCGGINLNIKHKNILLSCSAWLDDDLIGAAQSMLKQQHPEVGGLQLPILSEKFAMEPQTGEFVQLVNVHGSHWVAVSTVGCPPSAINVYDSLHGRLPEHAQKLVADIMQSRERAIEVRYVDVQWQSGACDCGLFALAFATCLCSGQDPVALNFDQGKMRSHLLSCLESGYITPFPLQDIRRQPEPKQSCQLIPIYCIYRLIDERTPMIQCSTCKDWFHIECVHPPQDCIENKSLPWKCENCAK